MDLKDADDYEKEDRRDLIARLMGAQSMGQFLLAGYQAFRSYGVDFMKLPEWQDQRELDEALKLKPDAAQSKIVSYFQKLTSALQAAIRRRDLKVVAGTEAPKE